MTALDKPGVLSTISGILGNHGISIESVIQKGRGHREAVPLVILTHEAAEASVKQAVAEIDALDIVTDKTVKIRILTNNGEE
jgi:homoserine dehydrogenase